MICSYRCVALRNVRAGVQRVVIKKSNETFVAFCQIFIICEVIGKMRESLNLFCPQKDCLLSTYLGQPTTNQKTIEGVADCVPRSDKRSVRCGLYILKT